LDGRAGNADATFTVGAAESAPLDGRAGKADATFTVGAAESAP
jgi:hypothetical protein